MSKGWIFSISYRLASLLGVCWLNRRGRLVEMMQAERGRRNGFTLLEDSMNGVVMSHSGDIDGLATIPAASSASYSPLPSSSGANYIEHRVSKMDTLAGVAIKYGVEIADIRRMNGLVTDLQMFAHKSLHIPLPGRHPPSPIVSNGSTVNGEQTPPRRAISDVLESFQPLRLKPPQHKVSPAMSSLQGYYGLGHPKQGLLAEGMVMAVYKSGRGHNLEDQPMLRESPFSDPVESRHRKSRSLVNGFVPENGEINDAPADSNDADRSIRRRQKADADTSLRTPERLLKGDSIVGGFPGSRWKSLAQRPKSGSRTDVDMVRFNAMPNGEAFVTDMLAAVRKSSSTSNLQESENGSFIWPSSKWSLKPDALTRPIFDGLPKPMTIRRNKAALD